MFFMKYIKILTVTTALLLLAAACADTTTDTTQPVLSTVTAPTTTTTQPADTTTTETAETPDEPVEPVEDNTTAETTTTTAETTETPDTTTTTAAAEATETPDATTDGDTTGEEDDTATETTTTTAEETTDVDVVEDDVVVEPVEDKTGDVSAEPLPEDDTTTETTEAPEEIRIDRVVVWDGVDSEDKCAVAGGIWTDTACEYWVFDDPADAPFETYWHPTLMDDAYHAVDPETVEADHSESLDTRGTWGIHNYHVFYHYNDLGDPQVQYETMREATRYGVRSVFVPLTDWVWFPHRYDVSWSDVPNVVAVTGTYPLGEQRTLLLHTDRDQRSGRPNIALPLPLPPPIRPTTPFTQPQWLEIAEAMGRDCLPVEEVWNGNGTEVTDPCTLKAIETAVDWMWRGNIELQQLAIRDGTRPF